jgi:hypothetical protein
LVQRVIQWVDSVKAVNGSTEQNVVMGLSMGGLVARYALADMTKRNISTQTRLLITHDSPHRGANVPLGLQYFIKMLGSVQLFSTNIRQVYPDYNDLDRLLAAPATQQLLLYRATTTNTYANNTFLDGDYRNMITFAPTDPQPSYRFIATSLGSECAKPLYSPYKTFINFGAGAGINISAKFIIFRIPIASYDLGFQAEAYSLPAAGTSAKLARVYAINKLTLFGFIDIFKELYENEAYTAGELLPVDGVPGANYPFIDTTQFDFIKNLPRFNPLITFNLNFRLFKFINVSLYAYYYNSGLKTDFTFVPVGSALDVSPFTTPVFSEKYVNGTNQNYPSTSETFIAQETVNSSSSGNATNNVHIRFTARNSRWLFNEMENLPNTVNCSDSCSNPYYISGNSPICNSESYFIPGLQRGASVSWSVSPNSVAFSSTTNNPTTITKTADANVTLTANITNACGGIPITLTKNIQVGVPTQYGSIQNLNNPNQTTYCLNSQDVIFTFNPTSSNSSITNYYWGYYNSSTGNSNQPILSANSWDFATTISSSLSAGTYTVFARPENACGLGNINISYITLTNDGCGGFGEFKKSSDLKTTSASFEITKIAIFPNPATNSITITLPKDSLNLPTTTIIITDISGRKVKQITTVSETNTIPVSTWAGGTYVVTITDGKKKIMKKIVKD